MSAKLVTWKDIIMHKNQEMPDNNKEYTNDNVKKKHDNNKKYTNDDIKEKHDNNKKYTNDDIKEKPDNNKKYTNDNVKKKHDNASVNSKDTTINEEISYDNDSWHDSTEDDSYYSASDFQDEGAGVGHTIVCQVVPGQNSLF